MIKLRKNGRERNILMVLGLAVLTAGGIAVATNGPDVGSGSMVGDAAAVAPVVQTVDGNGDLPFPLPMIVIPADTSTTAGGSTGAVDTTVAADPTIATIAPSTSTPGTPTTAAPTTPTSGEVQSLAPVPPSTAKPTSSTTPGSTTPAAGGSSGTTATTSPTSPMTQTPPSTPPATTAPATTAPKPAAAAPATTTPPSPATTAAPATTAPPTTAPPTTAPPATDPPTTTTAPRTTFTYVVQPGDNLSTIAWWFAINGYQNIYEANKDIIGSNPNLIFPGQVITIVDGVATMG